MAAILRDPYTSQCYWWAVLELFRRVPFILLINIVPGNLVCQFNIIAKCMYVGVIFHIHTY